MRHRLAYGLFRGLTLVVSLLPFRVAQRVGAGLAVLGSYATPGRRRMVRRHAERLGSGAGGVRAVFAGYGRYWAEAFWVTPRRLSLIQATTRAEGLDGIREAQAEGKGLIFALPHLGNWEFAGPIAEQLGFELVAVAENLENPHIRDWFVRLRQAMGIGIVLATGSAQVMRDLESVLSRNGAVALVCDRDLKGRGVAVSFFGEETTVPPGPVSLAIRTGAPVFPVAAYFEKDGGHRVVVLPRIELRSEGARGDVLAEGCQAVTDALESLIRRAPEQWHLLQPNWPSDRTP